MNGVGVYGGWDGQQGERGSIVGEQAVLDHAIRNSTADKLGLGGRSSVGMGDHSTKPGKGMGGHYGERTSESLAGG